MCRTQGDHVICQANQQLHFNTHRFNWVWLDKQTKPSHSDQRVSYLQLNLISNTSKLHFPKGNEHRDSFRVFSGFLKGIFSLSSGCDWWWLENRLKGDSCTIHYGM